MAAAGAASLVQYVVLRGDLSRPPLSWPLGAVVAQGCHAALAAAHAHRRHPHTAAYLELGGAMRTVVLEVRGAGREGAAAALGWAPGGAAGAGGRLGGGGTRARRGGGEEERAGTRSLSGLWRALPHSAVSLA